MEKCHTMTGRWGGGGWALLELTDLWCFDGKVWFIYQTKLTTPCSSEEAESQCDDTDRLSTRSMHSNPINLDFKLGEKKCLANVQKI